jgi:hypothetical protein
MTVESNRSPERPATQGDESTPPIVEPVAPGPVAILARHRAQATWARVGLLGIGVAAMLAAAILAFGFTTSPTGTLAAGSTSNGNTTDVPNLLGGGPGFHGGRGGNVGFGGITITAISGSSISLETEDGWTRTIAVDDGTTYSKAGADIALGDLAVGDTIGFRQTLEDDGTWTIDSIVMVLPHVGGEVTAVDASTITVERRDGTTATINVDGATTFQVNGDDAALADVEVGMFLVAEGTENADETLDAVRVMAGDEGFRGKGPGFRFGGPGWGEGKPESTTAPEATGSAS